MEQNDVIQELLDYMETNVKEELSITDLAEHAGYSPYHFSRMFSEAVGMPLKAYLLWRKLLHATCDLARGVSVTDVAMDYGFETHAGFTKAFKRIFGFPPSLCYSRMEPKPPPKPYRFHLRHHRTGGIAMQPHIYEMTPFSVIGYPQRYSLPNVTKTGDIPNYWETIGIDYGPLLTGLYKTFPYSKHMEIIVCFDTDEAKGEFSYMLGRGVDDPRDLERIEPEMSRLEIPGGLYAVFPTPITEEEKHSQAVRDTWNEIFTSWLPGSEFEFDDTRYDFTYHDYRDHGWYFGGKIQIDIVIPIRQKEEAIVRSRLRTGQERP